MKLSFSIGLTLFAIILQAQPDRWQQRVEYKMKIEFDVDSHQFTGEQEIKYFNNSPDTLDRVFYHLYFNAFQPGSMMDIRSRSIRDPDSRVEGRIARLSPDETGYHIVDELKQDGKPTTYEVSGTILEVALAKPLLPGKKTTLKMKFHSQVPLQIRRSGRDNKEGIDYSMSQWYPKLCEYDYQGWHANPYVGREFYGVWGDFEVEINIDDRYVLGGSGILQNADKVGRGYSDKEVKPKGKKQKWKFKAENVHDFVWAADRDYVVKTHWTKEGVKVYYLYQPGSMTTENWEALPKVMDEALSFMNKRYGKYPYPVYSFIQAGDGGMEYPMATLITGERTFNSLVGVSVHEWMHSWYQMVLGSNESLYAWMDEGFTSFATAEVLNYLRIQKLITGTPTENPSEDNITSYINFFWSGYEEALDVHADHFQTNNAYGVAAYTKGHVLLRQLEYILGETLFAKALLVYYNTWKFKHPNANDFFRIFEKVSGLELDWFKEYFVQTTHGIDYAVTSLEPSGDQTLINLKREGAVPMPLDVVVNYKDGTKSFINIPLRIMRGHKPNETEMMQYLLAEDWPWTHPEYQYILDANINTIESVEIDPSGRMADVDPRNNKLNN